MKKPNLLLSLIFTTLLVSAVFAQTAKFDVATYSAPAGYSVEKDAGSIRFTKEANGNYCVISLTRSVDGSDDASKNFEVLWQSMAVEGLNASASPQRGKGGDKDGWKARARHLTLRKRRDQRCGIFDDIHGQRQSDRAVRDDKC